jgi:hypothetical protein
MERNLTSAPINRELSPLCPRDNHKMTFQSDGVVWQQADTKEKLAGCHCGFMGCSVRYAPEHGYFTIVNAPDLIAGIHHGRTAEPNLIQRRSNGCYGTDGCDDCHSDVPGHWLRE